jgi:hypothetical protein
VFCGQEEVSRSVHSKVPTKSTTLAKLEILDALKIRWIPRERKRQGRA